MLSLLQCALQSIALLNDVALVSTESWVLCRAEAVTRTWCHASVAHSNLAGMLVIILTSVAQEECGFDARATDLRLGCIHVLTQMEWQSAALVQSTLASSITQNWLILNVHLLIVIQFQLLVRELTRGSDAKAQCNNCAQLHCLLAF